MAALTISDYKKAYPTVGLSAAPVVNSSSSPTIYLEGEPLRWFNEFFKDRVYEYRTTMDVAGGIKKLKVPLPLIPDLRQCVMRLKESGIKIKGVFLKGGVVHKVFTGSQKKLADLDLVIEIEMPRDWNAVEKAMFSGNWAGFLSPGMRKNRLLVKDQSNLFALYTLSTFHKDFQEDIDIQVLVKSTNSCFCSSDSIHIDLMPLIEERGGPISIRAVGGYDLEKALAWLKMHKFYVDTHAIHTLREGLRGYCHLLTRGEYPDDLRIERDLWEAFLKEYQPSQFTTFRENLKAYLQVHYFKDHRGKIFYLLNYCAIVSRCAGGFHAIEPQIFEELYGVAGFALPADNKDIRAEFELIQAYFYFQSPNKIFNNREHAFVAANADDFLLLAAPEFSTLHKRIEKGIDQYSLLQYIVTRGPYKKQRDLLAVFKQPIEKELKRREEVLKQKEALEKNTFLHFLALSGSSTPLKQAGETLLVAFANPRFSLSKLNPHQAVDLGRAVEKLVVELLSLKTPEVNLAQKIFEWILKEKDLFSPNRLEFLQSVFQLFCSRSRKTAMTLYRQLEDQNSLAYLHLFSQEINQEDAKKLFELIQFTLDKKKLTLEQCRDLLCEIVRQYPALLSVAWELIKTGDVQVQRSYFVQLFRNLTSKSLLFPYCQSLYSKLGQALFIDAEDVRLFYLQELAARDRKAALEFYGRSDTPTEEMYPIVAEAACSLGGKEWEQMLCQGLDRMRAKTHLEACDMKALDAFARYQDTILKIPVIKEKFQQLEQAVGAFSGLNKEKERIGAALKASKKLAPGIVEEKKQVETPAISNPPVEPEKSTKYFSSLFMISADEVQQISEVALSINQYAAGKKSEAFATLQKALKLHPKSMKLRQQLVNLYEQELNKIDEITKKHGDSLSLTAQAINYLKKVAQLYLECAQIAPTEIHWPTRYGFICYQLGEPSKALNAFESALKINATDPYLHMAIAGCHCLLGRADKAVEIMLNSIQKLKEKSAGPKEMIEAYLGLAKYYLTSSTPEKSAGEYERVFTFPEFDRDRDVMLEEYPKALLARANHALNQALFEPDKQKKAFQRAIIDFQIVIDTVDPDNSCYKTACLGSQKASVALKFLE